MKDQVENTEIRLLRFTTTCSPQIRFIFVIILKVKTHVFNYVNVYSSRNWRK